MLYSDKFYKKYVGSYVKRFYTSFEKENIFKIKDYRIREFHELNKFFSIPEFLYSNNEDEWWTDVEDSVIITNELPMIEDERLANIHHPKYKGYNPYLNK